MKLIEFNNLIEVKKAGSKAFNLAVLTENESEVNIPRSWLIEANLIEEVIEKAGFKRSSEGFDICDSEEIYSFLGNCPQTIFRKLWSLIEQLICETKIKRFAVRSSHSLEDGEKNSFAGQFKSYLNVNCVSNIVLCIMKCWRESFDVGVKEYLRILGEKNIRPCSIIIQEFIPCMCAGVAFKDNIGIYINANWGLAKHIVDGEEGFDEYIWKNDEEVWTISIGNKGKAIVPIYDRVNPLVGEFVSCIDLPNKTKAQMAEMNNSSTIAKVLLNTKLQKEQCLSEEQLENLKQVIYEVSSEVNIMDCDIEWGIDAEGNIYILQVRPLTKNIDLGKNTNRIHSNKKNIKQGMRLVGGCAAGVGYKINSEKDAKMFPEGGIIITKSLTGPLLHAAQKAAGCIVQAHSIISHSAIIARELGVPTVGAMDIDELVPGQFFVLNATEGYIEIRESNNEEVVYPNQNENCKNFMKTSISNIYDLRGILSVLNNLIEFPEDVKSILHEISNEKDTYICSGFADCTNSILELRKQVVAILGVDAKYVFDKEDNGKFIDYIKKSNLQVLL